MFAHPYGILRQEPAAERQGGQPYRDVHGEQPRPVGRGEDARRQRRPGHRRGGDHRGVDAHAASQPGLGVDEADQRGVDRGDGRGSEPLHDARQHEGLERPGERTAHRRHREEHQPADVDLAVTHHVAQRREGEQRDHDGQLVGVDDPDRIGRRDAQLLPDGGQGDVGDGPVDHRERYAEGHGQNGSEPLGHGQSVRRTLGYVGRGVHCDSKSRDFSGLFRQKARKFRAFVAQLSYGLFRRGGR